MATKDEQGLVRKAVFVPPALWQRVKIEAAERNIDLSDVFTEMLRDRYESPRRGAEHESPESASRP